MNMNNFLYAFMQARNNNLSGSERSNALINGAIAPAGTSGLLTTHLNVTGAIETQKVKTQKAAVVAELDVTNKAFEAAIKHIPADSFVILLKDVEVDERVLAKIKLHQPVHIQENKPK